MALPSIVRLRLALGQRLLRWGALLAGGPGPASEADEPPPELDAPPDAHRQWLDRVAHLPPEAWQGSQPGRAPVLRRRPAVRPAPGPVGAEAAPARRPPRVEADDTVATVRPLAASMSFFDRSRRAVPARPVAGVPGSVAAPRRVPVASFEAPTARPAPRSAGVPTAPPVAAQRLAAAPPFGIAVSRLRPSPVPPSAPAPRPMTPFRAAEVAAVGRDPRPAVAASASARERSATRTHDTPTTPPPARPFLLTVDDAVPAPPPRLAPPPATDRPPPAARRTALWSEPAETRWPELPPLPWGHEPASSGDEVRLAQRRERLAAEQRG